MNSVLISQMVQLFIIMSFGYLLFKLKYMTVEFNQKLSKVLLDFTTPLLILSSVMNTDAEISYAKIGSVFLISFLFYVFLSALSIVIVKIMRLPAEQQGIYMFMHTFSNVGFMGFPVINALYGSEAMIYTAILNIFFNLFAFTIGIMMMNYSGKLDGGIKDLAKLADLKKMITPGTIGSILAIAVYFIPVHFPEVVLGVCKSVGNLTPPLAMLLIGATLARTPVKNMFDDWHVYLFTVVKQIIVPVLLWPLIKLVIADNLVRSVMFILFLMPVGNTCVLFATRYGKDEELSAKNVFLTTLISMVTIPLILSLLKAV